MYDSEQKGFSSLHGSLTPQILQRVRIMQQLFFSANLPERHNALVKSLRKGTVALEQKLWLRVAQFLIISQFVMSNCHEDERSMVIHGGGTGENHLARTGQWKHGACCWRWTRMHEQFQEQILCVSQTVISCADLGGGCNTS